MLIREKVRQAVDILEENSVDCWITFVRESSMAGDPMLSFLCASDLTWHSAFIITRHAGTYAIVGEMERKSIEDLGVYDQILSYVEGIRETFVDTLRGLDPGSILLNYSRDSEIADGLTHGMYLTLMELLEELGFQDRVMSSEKVVSSVRARKTPGEIERMEKAVKHTLEIFDLVADFIRPGLSELEIAAFMKEHVRTRGLELAWDEHSCPAVFTGPDTAGAHYRPTERLVENGHVLNMDFGVKVGGYCSDLQRTFYVLEEGESEAPPEVQHGFETITSAIEKARQVLQPGVQGLEVDTVARQHIVAQGFEEYPHGLGHQVGRFAHDGTALLGPAWEKYAGKIFEPVEAGMVFTLEPRLLVPGRGIVTVEEMVIVGDDGAEFLSAPQTELRLVRC